MRINLFDELLADAIGMKTALGHFQAELFRQGLGLNLAELFNAKIVKQKALRLAGLKRL